jgi:YD repeat-containing protein
VTYPSQRTITTTYDAAGRPNGVTGYASGIAYAPHGALAGVTFGNGVQESWSFNVRLAAGA